MLIFFLLGYFFAMAVNYKWPMKAFDKCRSWEEQDRSQISTSSGTRERTDLELDWKEGECTAPGQISYSCNETTFTLLPILPMHSCSLELCKGSVKSV